MSEQQVWSDNARAMMAYARIDSERIESGNFTAGEKKMLQALAQAESFLQERYPAEKMTFTQVNNVSINAQTYQFEVVSSAAPEDSFVVKVTPAGNPDGTDRLQESRFNDMMKPQLQALVQELLAREAVENICDLEIIGLYDESHDPQKSLVELLKTGLLVDVTGQIYIPEKQDAEALVPLLGRLLRGEGLCGGVSLVQVSGQSMEQAAALSLWKNPYVIAKHYVSLPADNTGEAE